MNTELETGMADTNPLSGKRQPDTAAEGHVAPTPSLLLYAALICIAVGLIFISFREKPDWPALLLHIATEILVAVFVLILVERRLRQRELRLIRSVPHQTRLILALALSLQTRRLYRYNRHYLVALERVLRVPSSRNELSSLRENVDQGVLLIGDAGTGKTTLLQTVSMERARAFLNDPIKAKVPLVFPLTRWLPDRTLEEALYEYFRSFSHISSRAFRSAVRKNRILFLLDGASEVFMWPGINLSNGLAKLK